MCPREATYYDVSLLKPPVWGWEISGYFFFGGASAAAFILGRLAERLGDDPQAARDGADVAALAALPCAPLLIKDLGDPKRFHHMLRVFKPRTPMSLGTWIISAYLPIAVLQPLLCRSRRRPRLVQAALDAAGIPLALGMTCYTGVLLSNTATPLWCRNLWLAPLFAASSFATGSAATQLRANRASKALEKTDTAAHALELITMAALLTSAGELAQPLVKGELAPWFWGAMGATVGSEVLKHTSRRGKVAGALLGLAGGFALRWALVHAGKASAEEPGAARKVTSGKARRPRLERKENESARFPHKRSAAAL